MELHSNSSHFDVYIQDMSADFDDVLPCMKKHTKGRVTVHHNLGSRFSAHPTALQYGVSTTGRTDWKIAGLKGNSLGKNDEEHFLPRLQSIRFVIVAFDCR